MRQLSPDEVGAVEVAAPFAPAQRVVPARHEASFGKDGADREFGDRGGVATGRIDDENAQSARGGEINVHLTAARRDDQLKRGQPRQHRGGERRELGDGDLGVADKADDRVGVPLVFLEAVHPGLRVAVPHRLVGPGQLHRRDGERTGATGSNRRFKRHRSEESVADYGDLRFPRSLARIRLLFADSSLIEPRRASGKGDLREGGQAVILGRWRLGTLGTAGRAFSRRYP